jgi:hypothetical protein
MSDFRFLLPAGLIALISLPLVVLFHMRSPTPRSVPVPALRFWQVAAPRPTDEPRFRRPPLTLSLVLHLLTALVLSLALAKPAGDVFAGALGDSGAPRHLVILLDGSTSMLATDTSSGDSRFDDAKASAVSEINGLHAGDAATVLVMGAQTRSRSASDTGALKQLASFVRDLEAPGGRSDLTGALLLASDLRVPGMANEVLLLSDGALTADPGAVQALGATIEERRFGDPATGNVAIVGAGLRNDPANPAAQQMTAQLVNDSDEDRTVTVEFAADSVRVASQEYTVAANDRQSLLFPVPAGAKLASMTITTEDALRIDNTAIVPVGDAGAGGLSVLIFSDQPDVLSRAFGALPGARLTLETSDAATEGMGTGGYDLVVYDQVTPSVAPISPALFVAPPDSDYFRSPAMLADSAIAQIDASDPAMANVDLTGVTFGVTPQYELPPGFTAIVSAADGPLIARGVLSNGQLPAALIASPLETSNLGERIAFPIMIANLAQLLAPAPAQSVYTLGDSVTIQPHAGTATITVTNPIGTKTNVQAPQSGADGTLLGQTVFTDSRFTGRYIVDEVDSDGGEVSSRIFTVNAGDETEANLRANPDLAGLLASATSAEVATSADSRLNDLWPLLAVLALALLTIEWLTSARGARRSAPASAPRSATS